jgi:hypothetical protein
MFKAIKRKQILKSYSPTTDIAFMEMARIAPEQRGIAYAMRKVIADMCGLDRMMVHADTPFADICSIMCISLPGGWDEMDFGLRLERELGVLIAFSKVRLPQIAAPTNPSTGEWIRDATSAIAVLGPAGEKPET